MILIDRSNLPVPAKKWCTDDSYHPPDDGYVPKEPSRQCVTAAKVVLGLVAGLGVSVGIVG